MNTKVQAATVSIREVHRLLGQDQISRGALYEAVKRGDIPHLRLGKVRVLPERGSTKKGDQRLWIVKRIWKVDGLRIARLELLGSAESETRDVTVDDLVVVTEFRDFIYPGLVSTGKVERGGNKPFHTVINGENYHALTALTYAHRVLLP
jgi:adenine-specific DNA-methyltransferase